MASYIVNLRAVGAFLKTVESKSVSDPCNLLTIPSWYKKGMSFNFYSKPMREIGKPARDFIYNFMETNDIIFILNGIEYRLNSNKTLVII